MSGTKRGYNEGVVLAQVTGWVCLTCKSFYGSGEGAEHIARYCCARAVPCSECGADAKKPYTLCEPCRAKADTARWERRKRQPYDGKGAIYSDTLDRYYFGEDAIEEANDDAASNDITLEEMHLLICDPQHGSEIDIREHFQDVLPDDEHGSEPDLSALDEPLAALNKAIRDLCPLSWVPGNVAVALEGEARA